MGRISGQRAALSALFAWFVLALATAASGCAGSTPTRPTTPPVKIPPPQPEVPNNPPTITSLTLSSPRAEAGEDVQVTAVVEDTDTPVDRLTYDWSSTPVNSAFSGSARQVRWTAPASFQTTPDLYTLTLKVTENYTSNGQPKANSAWSGMSVHYNDSRREIAGISFRFNTELFPDYSLPAAAAVQDFTDNVQDCPHGKTDELNDIRNNRVNFHILSGTYSKVSIDLNSDKTFANVSGACEFRDIPMDSTSPYYGMPERISGTCNLTAIYESWKWFLCESHFGPPYSGPTLEGLRYRVPGRIIQP